MPNTVASAARIANAGSWAARAGFATATAFYVVSLDTADAGIEVWKSTDGTTWTEQDAADSPVAAGTTQSFSAYLAADGYLYVLYASTLISGGAEYSVRRFDTATDAWETAALGGTIATTLRVIQSVRVLRRSGGDVLAAGTNIATSTRLDYARYNAGAWTTVALTTAGHWVNDLVLDSTDRAWFAFVDNVANDNSYISLSNTNVLGSLTDFDASAHTTAKLRAALGVTFHDGANNRLAILGRDTGGELDLYHGTTGAATLGSLTTINAVTTTVAPNTTSAAMAYVDTGSGAMRLVAVWSTANTILRDVSGQAAPAYTFGADTTVLSGLTDADPCPQWLVGLGGYGVLYQDNGAVKVEWVIAPSPPAGAELEGTGTGSALATATRISVSHPMTGTGNGTALAAATRIRLSHPLTGSGIGQAVAPPATLGSVAASHPLTGSGIGTALALAAALKVGHPLVGSGVGAALAQAQLLKVSHPLAGAALGSALASAPRIRLSHPLSGSAIGSSLTLGNLDVPGDALAGVGIGTSYAAATGLRFSHALAGAALGGANADATRIVVGHPLLGAALGSALAHAARIRLSHPLSGSAIGSSLTLGDLHVEGAPQSHPLAGVAIGISVASAARLSVGHPLTGQGVGNALADAVRIAVSHSLTGQALGDSFAAGDRLRLSHALEGIAIGHAYAVGVWSFPLNAMVLTARGERSTVQAQDRVPVYVPERSRTLDAPERKLVI